MSVELADAKFVGVEPNRTDVVREAPPEGRKKPLAAEAPAPVGDEPIFVIDESSDLPLWVQLRNRLAHLIRTGYFKAGRAAAEPGGASPPRGRSTTTR